MCIIKEEVKQVFASVLYEKLSLKIKLSQINLSSSNNSSIFQVRAYIEDVSIYGWVRMHSNLSIISFARIINQKEKQFEYIDFYYTCC